MILIVDDHPDTIAWMKLVIQGEGYYCDDAIDATVAFYKIQSMDYALAIIDIGLPDYPGDVLAKLIRSQKNERSRLPLIAMSGKDFIDEDGLFDFVLLKPFGVDALTEAIIKYAKPPIKDLHATRKMWETLPKVAAKPEEDDGA